MDRWLESDKAVPNHLECEVIRVIESNFHYQAKNYVGSELIVNWLIRLIVNNWTWGFGICCLYLRNIKLYME